MAAGGGGRWVVAHGPLHLAQHYVREVGASCLVTGQLQQAGTEPGPDPIVVVDVEQQRGQVERTIPGEDGRVDVDHPGNRRGVGEQISGGEIVMHEICAGRDGRAAARADIPHRLEQIARVRAGREGGVQAVSVAALGQRPDEQGRPVGGAGGQASL